MSTARVETPRLSVVIATYNRPVLVLRLVRSLAGQTLPASEFEVVVVDDGSREDVRPALGAEPVPYSLRIERQENRGAAAARQRGAALSRGEILVFVDDDMEIPPHFLETHLAAHDRTPKAVVLGEVRRDASFAAPIFERFHMRILQRFAEDVALGHTRLEGPNLYTGNVSVRRPQFERIGGFDLTLGRAEDVELGIRLEKDGANFVMERRAFSVHGTDHTSLDGWLGSAFRYGVFGLRISRKHPDALNANPFQYFYAVNPVSRAFLATALFLPGMGERVARAAIRVAGAVDRAGLEGVGIAGATLAFGVQYVRGVRAESGSLGAALHGLSDYVAARTRSAFLRRAARAFGRWTERPTPREPTAGKG